MSGPLLIKEFQEMRESLRFVASALLIVLIMIFSAVIYSAQYRSDTAAYHEVLRTYAQQIQDATVDEIAALHHPAIKPPWHLAFLADGGQSLAPSVYHQTLFALDEPNLARINDTPPRLLDPEALDWAFVVKIILSLGAFVLGYDAICGERKKALLRFVLSYSIRRRQILAAKLFAIWTSLALPFLLGAGLSLLVLIFYGGMSFAGEDLIKILSMLGLSLWAILFFVLIALLVSALSGGATRSLITLALIWIVAVEVIPNAAALGAYAEFWQKIPTSQQQNQRMAQIRQEVEDEHGGPGSWRNPKWATVDDFALERRAAAIQNLRYDRQEAERRLLLEGQLQQVELTRRLAALSPMYLIQTISERLIGSGLERDRSFLEQTWRFRDCLAEHVKELDLQDARSPHLHFFTGYLSRLSVDPQKFPRFQFQELARHQRLKNALPGLLLLSLLTLLLILATALTLARYDVG